MLLYRKAFLSGGDPLEVDMTVVLEFLRLEVHAGRRDGVVLIDASVGPAIVVAARMGRLADRNRAADGRSVGRAWLGQLGALHVVYGRRMWVELVALYAFRG